MDALRPFRFRILLAALILLVLAYPYARETPVETGLLVGLATGVLLAGVFAAAGNRRTLAIGVLLAMPAALADIAATLTDRGPLWLWGSVFEATFYGFVTFEISRSVFSTRRVTSDTIVGAVCIYLLLALAWSSLYGIVEALQPGSFHFPAAGHVHEEPWPELLFFSFTALTTVGYGDITPLTSQARSLASLESATGVLYTAVLVARLVGSVGFEEEPA